MWGGLQLIKSASDMYGSFGCQQATRAKQDMLTFKIAASFDERVHDKCKSMDQTTDLNIGRTMLE